jgi:hypothetical protein
VDPAVDVAEAAAVVTDGRAMGVSHLPQDLRAQARRAGGGWLDEVLGEHPPGSPIPLTAIKGSWRLDGNGVMTGEYIPNPLFGLRRSGVCPLHAKRS